MLLKETFFTWGTINPCSDDNSHRKRLSTPHELDYIARMREDFKRTEKLYGTLGELIYCVAKADGTIQVSEFDKLDEILRDHRWASTIRWSFDYEVKKNSDPEEAYKKVINMCEKYGPSKEYIEYIQIITAVAEASDGVDDNEDKLIRSFSHDLIERFKKDIKRIGTDRR